MSDLNVSIIMKLVNRVGAGAREVERDLQGIRGHLGQLGRLAGRAAMATGTAAAAAGANAVRAAATMQDALSEANKTLGYSSEQMEALKDDIADLAQVVPLQTQEFVAMAGAAGNAGITAREEVLAFLEDAAKMKFAMDGLNAEEVLLNWREGLDMPIQQLRAVADQVNYLGNTTAAGARPLAEYASRALAAGEMAGYVTEETLALGAAMIAQGVAPEAATTSFMAFNRTMKATSAALSTTQQDVLESMGILNDWDEIQEQMMTDATGAIRRVVEALQSLPEAARTSAMNQLFGDEAGRNLAPVIQDIERFETAMARAGDTVANSAGSIQQEFETVADDVPDNLQRVMNAIAGKNNSFGELFLDPLNEGLKELAATIHEMDASATSMERISAAAGAAAVSFSKWVLPDFLDPVIDFLDRFSLVDALRGKMDFAWADVLPDWNWGDIIPDLPDFASIRDRARDLFTWGDEAPGTIDAPDVEVPTIREVRAETGEVEELQRRIAEVSEAADALPPAVADMVRQSEAAVAGLDLAAHGERIMDTLADGIRSGTAGVVAAVAAMADQVRAALPTSPAVDLVARAAPAASIQARARGGRFGPGWTLTGEEGAELIYRSQGGFVAHHGQLREMAALSETIRRNAAGARPVTRMAAGRPGAAARSVTVGDIVINAAPGMSPQAIAAEVRRELGRAARRGDDALHDGGLFDA